MSRGPRVPGPGTRPGTRQEHDQPGTRAANTFGLGVRWTAPRVVHKPSICLLPITMLCPAATMLFVHLLESQRPHRDALKPAHTDAQTHRYTDTQTHRHTDTRTHNVVRSCWDTLVSNIAHRFGGRLQAAASWRGSFCSTKRGATFSHVRLFLRLIL